METLQAQPILYRLFIFARMNKAGKWVLVILTLLLLSCSDDIKLTGEGEPIPIVYAIFDTSDSIHYIKLGKSFADESSVENQLDEKHLYYSNPEVSIVNLSSGVEYSFRPSQEQEKDDGYFPISPNPIYMLDKYLNTGEYLVRIKPDNESMLIEEKVLLFNDLKIFYPGKSTKRIYFYDDPSSFIWSHSSNASTYELAFTLEYEESNDFSEIQNKSITYSRTINTDELEWMQNRWKFRLYSDPFYGKIGQKIEEDEAIKYRKPTNLILKISAVGFELNQFIEQNNPDTEIEINYTGNLSDAIGIVAAKYTVKIENLQLSPKAMDSLRSGRFTKNLKFVSNSDW